MTGRKWKPGDVVSVRCEDGLAHRAIVVNAAYLGGLHVAVPTFALAHGMDANQRLYFGNGSISQLVTIDPAGDDPERLQDLFWQNQHHSGLAMQAALREFADPKQPRPEEPTGLGAVVEDDKGNVYVRHPATGNEANAWCDPIGCGRPWSRVNAVRVLSEGWVK